MKVVILQPSYIPWRGYFHLIQKADVFVFYDCVQYDKNGWRNRNLIKTAQGTKWLTIPVSAENNVSSRRPICEIPIVWKSHWSAKHRKTIDQSYARAPFLKEYKDLLDEIYGYRDALLVDFTCRTTELIARRLGISHTKFLRSSNLQSHGEQTDRLISILQHLNAKHYISGPSAKNYIETKKFQIAGIKLEFIQYQYSEYPQIHGSFISQVSVLDVLFNVGSDAPKLIWQQE